MMIQDYFNAEKKAAFFALAVGLIACSVASAIFISARPPFYSGLALGLLIIGTIQMIVGVGVARRSDLQANELEATFSKVPVEFVQTELPRMQGVLLRFNRYKWIEIGVLVLGLALFFFNKEPLFSKGLGLGLIVQALIMLVFDYFAEKRARWYLDFIQKTKRQTFS
jgi:hypothetical protein